MQFEDLALPESLSKGIAEAGFTDMYPHPGTEHCP